MYAKIGAKSKSIFSYLQIKICMNNLINNYVYLTLIWLIAITEQLVVEMDMGIVRLDCMIKRSFEKNLI
jgi:hypothetical protein